jgi:hypothetical protein
MIREKINFKIIYNKIDYNMSFFKKISKSVNKAFSKAPSVVSNIFKKGGDIAGKVGEGLGKVSNVLGQVADVGGQILRNPLVEMAGSALLGPEFGVGAAAAGTALGQIKRGSQIAGRASNIASRAGDLSREASGYGSTQDVMRGIEKAKQLAKDAGGVAGPEFA